MDAKVRIKRAGNYWIVDLRQGIDLAIYLFGSFEPEVLAAYRKLIQSGAVVFDIGANVGAHTIPMARLVGDQGSVIAFEPTDYAFNKLIANIAQNPEISRRIAATQTMLTGPETRRPDRIPSAWSLESVQGEDVHAIHGGTFKSLSQANLIQLDTWVDQNITQRLDLLKLDVDGYEIDVIEGGIKTLSRIQPPIIMEFAPYTFEERGRSFDDLLRLLASLRYVCKDLHGNTLPLDQNILSLIPAGGSINVILTAT